MVEMPKVKIPIATFGRIMNYIQRRYSGYLINVSMIICYWRSYFFDKILSITKNFSFFPNSLNMDSTSSSGPGPPAARSISRVETASPSPGFSYDACRLGVSCRLAQGRRLSDSCLKAVNGLDDARLMHSSYW